MSKIEMVSKDVYVSREKFPSIGREDIQFVSHNVASSPKGRLRICVHKVNEDRMHEMFISFTGNNYVRPSLHTGKDESLHVLNGDADYFFFDKFGNVTDQVSLGTYESGRPFYCRIPESTDHALFIRSDSIDFHESTTGPFRREDTVFAAWSPEDTDSAKVAGFLDQLSKRPRRETGLLKMKRTGEEVFVADEPIVHVGKLEMDFLKDEVGKTSRKRVRLCAHKDGENTLHEMFVVYMNMTYVKPNMHVDKDESLHILEGEADFIFFDDKGEIVHIIPLGDYNSGRQFYCRVPAFAYHTLIMKSERLVIHEVTPGPFRRSDTVWAPWAPDENDAPAVTAFMDRLRAVSV
jgi:cupin fold WbuC family metalloprotein